MSVGGIEMYEGVCMLCFLRRVLFREIDISRCLDVVLNEFVGFWEEGFFDVANAERLIG